MWGRSKIKHKNQIILLIDDNILPHLLGFNNLKMTHDLVISVKILWIK